MGKRKLTLISMIEVIHLIVEMAYCIGNSVALNCDKVRLNKSAKKRYKELFQKELKLRCYGTVGLEPVDLGSTTSAVAIEAYGSFIAAAKRGMYITNELIVLFPIHYSNIYGLGQVLLWQLFLGLLKQMLVLPAGLLLFLSLNTALLCTKVPFAMPLLLDMDGTLLTHLHIASVENHSL